jgi:hypothetical protein
MKVTEHQIQAALFKWAKFATARYPDLRLMFAIPNGGARSPITGSMLKAEGVKAGVPDIFLPLPVGRFHGLFLEMKTPTGRLSPKQREWQMRLRNRGYAAVTAYGLEEGIDILTRYLADRLEAPDPGAA